jgi:Cof subfamily protein (haloacid dehalogenase superfamily)
VADRFKALAIDVDGTLVDRTLKIRPRNLAALRAARAAGVSVVLATGRMFRSALPYALEIGTEEPIICYQGAVVRTPGGEVLREWPVDPESAVAAVEFSRTHDLHINLYQDDSLYIERDSWGARRYAEVAQVEPIMLPDLMELARGGSTKVVFVDQPERLRGLETEVRRLVEPRSRVTFSMPEFLEVVAAEVNKGRALEVVCERLGITPAEVLAAGDAQNDVEMLRVAGTAVAPRTAHPDALAVADATVAPPEEDGVAELVERFLLG